MLFLYYGEVGRIGFCIVARSYKLIKQNTLCVRDWHVTFFCFSFFCFVFAFHFFFVFIFFCCTVRVRLLYSSEVKKKAYDTPAPLFFLLSPVTQSAPGKKACEFPKIDIQREVLLLKLKQKQKQNNKQQKTKQKRSIRKKKKIIHSFFFFLYIFTHMFFCV